MDRSKSISKSRSKSKSKSKSKSRSRSKSRSPKKTKEMNIDSLTKITKMYFKDKDVEVIKYDNVFYIEITCNNYKSIGYKSIGLSIKISDSTDDNTLSIDIIQSPCDNIKGKEIIDKCILIAKKLHIKNIILTDASRIILFECSIPLYMVSIVLNGQSWYNKMNFVSENYENERKNNNYYFNLTTEQFITKIRKVIDEKYEKDKKYALQIKVVYNEENKKKDIELVNKIDDLCKDNYKEPFNKAFSKIYYKAIEDDKNKKKEKEKCYDLISLIINFLFMLFNHDIILYDTSLKYEWRT